MSSSRSDWRVILHRCQQTPTQTICIDMNDTLIYMIAGLEVRVLSALQAIISTLCGHFRLLLPPPCPSATTAPEEGLPGGLLQGSCGRRRRRGLPIRQSIGKPTYLFQNMTHVFPKAMKRTRAARSSFSANWCFDKGIDPCLETLSST